MLSVSAASCPAKNMIEEGPSSEKRTYFRVRVSRWWKRASISHSIATLNDAKAAGSRLVKRPPCMFSALVAAIFRYEPLYTRPMIAAYSSQSACDFCTMHIASIQ